MSISLKNRAARRAVGNTDPAHAFGSEEQLMAEFQRQEYTQPAPRPASVLTGIRQRLSGLTARPHQTDAPVYSADTYAQETAPDLGWEAAFDPEAAAVRQEALDAARQQRAATAEERYESFRRSVYSTPIRPRAEYTDLTAAAAARAVRPAPVYEEITLGAREPRENRETAYQKPVYEEISFGPRQPEPPQPAEALPGGPEQDGFDGPVYYDEFGQSVDPAAGMGMPGTAAPAVSDGKYLFWSGTILAGIVLTLFSFVYACAM